METVVSEQWLKKYVSNSWTVTGHQIRKFEENQNKNKKILKVSPARIIWVLFVPPLASLRFKQPIKSV